MNLLLFSQEDRIDAETIAVADARLTHLLQVHRATAGDSVRVGEINGLTGSGEILQLDAARAVIRVQLDQPPPCKLPVTLIVALPRPKMLRRILRTVAELGISHLHLLNSYRVEKSYWQTPVLHEAQLNHYLREGLAQACDTQLPSVYCHRRFKPFVEDELPALLAGKTAVLFHPGTQGNPNEPAAGETAVVIGPEGGFIPYEVEMLQAAGCQLASLGPRILRVENAVSVVLGQYLNSGR